MPFENSTNGQVVFTYDLLRDWFISDSSAKYNDPKFKIVAEQYVAIHHYFLSNAKSLADITTLYSHPQVWGQVSKFLSEEEISKLKLKKFDTSSTSKAAENVYNDQSNTSACICSKMSSDLYNLPVLYEKVEDNPNNTTRFLVLGYEKPLSPLSPIASSSSDSVKNHSITSIMFTLHHDDPGALCSALDSFREFQIKMTSINSRPSHREQWQYVFFIELIGDMDNDLNIKQSIDSLSKKCVDLVVLGSFERSWRYWGA